VVVTFKKLEIIDELEKLQMPPGTILNYQSGKLLVSSSDPQVRLQFSEITLHFLFGPLPQWLGRLATTFLFRSGRMFVS
jgi:hypothetical protein